MRQELDITSVGASAPPGLNGRSLLKGGNIMAEDRMRVSADVCSCIDEKNNKLNLEVSIPGVRRENIDLKMHEDSFSLTAPRDDIEYVTTLGFCCPVNPKESSATYEDGLLKISVPFKDPMDGAFQVQVS